MSDEPTIDRGSISATDAMFLKGESDLRTRQTGHSVYLLDSIPDWDRFFAVWERASRLLWPLNHRIVRPPGFGRLPEWRFDPDLDLRVHVRRWAVPAPGSLREVLEMAEVDGMALMDEIRPLWQVTLIEGLEGDRAALLVKFHHLWVDGKTLIEVERLIFESERDGDLGRPMPPMPSPPEGKSPLAAAVNGVEEAAERARSVSGQVIRRGFEAASHPLRTLSDGGELIGSTRRVFTPPASNQSELLAPRSFGSRFDVLDVPFADLRRAVKSVGCTINDGYMAGITGGLRLYHERLGSHVDSVGIGMPMSTSLDDKLQTGNQVSAALLTFPVDVADPIERLHQIHEMVQAHRKEPAADLFMQISQVLVFVPERVYVGAMARFAGMIDFTASQVPGMMEPRFVAGSQLTHYYGFGPRLGAAGFFGMMTHLGNCCIGVHTDPAAVTEPELFVECLRDSFDEILALADAEAG